MTDPGPDSPPAVPPATEPVWDWLQQRTKPFLAALPFVLVALRLHRVSHGRLSTELLLFESSGTLPVVYGALAPIFVYLLFAGAIISIALAVLRWRTRSLREHTLVLGTVGACLFGIMAITVPVLQLLYLAVWLVLLLIGFVVAYRVVAWDRQVRPAWPAILAAAGVAFLLVQVGFDNRPWNVPEVIVYKATTYGNAAPERELHLTGYVIKSESGDLTVMKDTDRTVIRIAGRDLESREACSLDAHGFALFEAEVARSRTILEYLGEQTGGLRSCAKVGRSAAG